MAIQTSMPTLPKSWCKEWRLGCLSLGLRARSGANRFAEVSLLENPISTNSPPQRYQYGLAETANRVTRLASVASNKLKKHGNMVSWFDIWYLKSYGKWLDQSKNENMLATSTSVLYSCLRHRGQAVQAYGKMWEVEDRQLERCLTSKFPPYPSGYCIPGKDPRRHSSTILSFGWLIGWIPFSGMEGTFSWGLNHGMSHGHFVKIFGNSGRTTRSWNQSFVSFRTFLRVSGTLAYHLLFLVKREMLQDLQVENKFLWSHHSVELFECKTDDICRNCIRKEHQRISTTERPVALATDDKSEVVLCVHQGRQVSKQDNESNSGVIKQILNHVHFTYVRNKGTLTPGSCNEFRSRASCATYESFSGCTAMGEPYKASGCTWIGFDQWTNYDFSWKNVEFLA